MSRILRTHGQKKTQHLVFSLFCVFTSSAIAGQQEISGRRKKEKTKQIKKNPHLNMVEYLFRFFSFLPLQNSVKSVWAMSWQYPNDFSCLKTIFFIEM